MPQSTVDPPLKKIFLLDAFALIYRAHFAFAKRQQINSKGQNTSIPLGFTNTLLEIIQQQKPSHIGVAFDTAKATFRHEMFSEYKANRDEAPEEIQYNLPIVKNIIRAFNIPILLQEGYEADDIIGTIATQANRKGFQVYMMSSDKDLGQLVTDNTFLYKPAYMGHAVHIMGRAEICNKWDIQHPSQVIDMLGLQGDSSDNIPGVPGIGPKTAASLLKQYPTIEELIANAPRLKNSYKEKILRYAEQAILSKQLAKIALDVPVPFNEKELEYTQPNEKALRNIFDELEFKKLTNRMFGAVGRGAPSRNKKALKNNPITLFDKHTEKTPWVSKKTTKTTHHTVDTTATLATLANQLLKQPEFAFEAITKGNVHADFEIIGLAYYFPENSYYVPINSQDEARNIVEAFSAAFSCPLICKIGHHIKKSVIALLRYGVFTKGAVFDTMLAHYLLDAEQLHNLDALTSHYLGEGLPNTEDEANNTCLRLEMTFLLADKLRAALAQKGHVKLMQDIESPLILTLADMEATGINIDENTLRHMSETLKKESDHVRKEIHDLAGIQFNIASPKQVGEVLFNKLHLIDKPKKTPTGQYITNEEVLRGLAKKHKIAQKMLSFRAYEKLRSTYVEALPKMICRSDKRVHTDYRQAVVATGRLSSVNPNLQNIPIRTLIGRQIRRAFVPKNVHYTLMSADYSQIELRIAAAFAQDKTMMDAFTIGRDIHTTTAAKIFATPLEKVTLEMRRKAKEVNFGILYGSGPFGLAQNLGITRSEATEIITSYFHEFSAIQDYIRCTVERAREAGYVETILGRRRYLRDINSRNRSARNFAERNAVNAPIQGSAADIIKIAMLHIHRWLVRKKLKTKMLLQVHDELVFDVCNEEHGMVKSKVVELMENAVILDVPMKVEVGAGQNWLEAH